MKSTSAFRVGLGTILAATGILASGVFSTAVATTKTPQLVVSPSAGLKNHETVKVRGVNFTPKDSVYIVECLAKATGGSQCDTATATPATISKTGTFGWTKFKVVTGAIGTGSCGTKRTNLKSCAISVGNATGGDSAVYKISFVLAK